MAKLNPEPGERYAKVVTVVREGRTITMVKSRTVLEAHGERIIYTPKRVRCETDINEWREWVRDARLHVD